MTQISSNAPDESSLMMGQLRKLNAIRRSVGDEIEEKCLRGVTLVTTG